MDTLKATDLFSLVDPLINKVGEGLPVDESAVPWPHV